MTRLFCLLCATLAVPSLSAAQVPDQPATLQADAQDVRSLAFSPDGKTLAAGSENGTIRLWNLAARKAVVTLDLEHGIPTCVAFSPGGTVLAAINDEDEKITLWDGANGNSKRTLRDLHEDREDSSILSIAFSPDGKTLAAGSQGGKVMLLEVASGKITRRLEHPGWVGSVAFSPNGKTLASLGVCTTTVKLWDVATGKSTAEIGEAVWSMAFSPDGRTIALGGREKTIRLWDVASGKTAATFTGDDGDIRCVEFRPNGKMLATTSLDKSIHLWDVASRKRIGTLSSPGIQCMKFSPDGKILAAAGADGTIRLWNMRAAEAKASSRAAEDKDQTKGKGAQGETPTPAARKGLRARLGWLCRRPWHWIMKW
jgi:WD40 repeat protein